ncbi:MAG: response regulator [Chloroherpetonaceae bacterium]|nr:response regulator [Chloroherpetonaceae bacterium]MDW8438252.1 response regulator [Chloroherpetonaceae bacterium]
MSATTAQRRVLIVDDEPNVPVGLLKMLSQSPNYYAKHAPSGEAAVEELSKSKYDLVITDIRMHGMTGIDLLRHIRANHADVGVIIMTAYGSAQVQEEASRRGSLLYIEKPFDFAKMQATIEDFFKRKEESAAASAKEEESVSGVIPGLSLMDVIQMNCLGRFTGTLHVKTSDGQQGIICFNKGEIPHCETATRSGKDAFFEIISWQGGTFETIEQIPPTVTIVESWEQLMMEAAMMMPDAPAEQQQATTKPKPAPRATAPKVEPAPADTSKMLDRVMEAAKAEVTFIVTHTGFVIDKRIAPNSKIDLNKSGDEISKLLPGIFGVAKTLAAGTLNEIMLRYEGKIAIIRNVAQSDLLFIVISPSSVPSGEIFKAIERESENIKKIL